MQRARRQLLPTPESPTMMTLNWISLSGSFRRPFELPSRLFINIKQQADQINQSEFYIIENFFRPTIFIIDSMKNNLLLSGHSVAFQAQVLSVAYNHNSSLLASAGVDRTILLWSPTQSYDNVAALKSHSNAVTALAWSHTDVLLSVSADKNLIAWDIQHERVIRKYKGHKCIVHSVAAPKKTLEIYSTVSDDGTAKVWEARSKKQICTFSTKYPLTSVEFSLNGDRLFVGGLDNEIKIFNLAERREEQVIKGHQDTISGLSISFDGTYLLSSSFDETIRIWDVRGAVLAENRLKKTLSGYVQGHEKTLIRGGWSVDGLYACCGSADRCVYIWDITTRKIVQRLGGHNGTVIQTCMGKDNWLASCSNDHNVIVSQLPEIFL